MGEMYEKGEGVRQNLAMAIDMYKCAVEFGFNEAQKELERLIPAYKGQKEEESVE